METYKINICVNMDSIFVHFGKDGHQEMMKIRLIKSRALKTSTNPTKSNTCSKHDGTFSKNAFCVDPKRSAPPKCFCKSKRLEQ